MSFDSLFFKPMNFISNLTYLAAGMIGIFVVMGVIILFTFILNKLLSKKSDDKQND